jgi:hypothetical protein
MSLNYQVMLLIFLLIFPLVLWLIPLSGLRKNKNTLSKSFTLNFVSMIFSLIAAAAFMFFYDMNASTILVVLLSISTCWGAIFHLINKRT